MAETDGVSEGGNEGGGSDGRSDAGVSEETRSSVDAAMSEARAETGDSDADPSGTMSGPVSGSVSGSDSVDDDGMTADVARDAQARMEAEGRAARESFERREAAVREMERTAGEAALSAAVETHDWTPEEQAALDRGTSQGVADAAEGWVSDVVDGVIETATIAGQGIVVGVNSGAAALADMGLERMGPLGSVMDVAAEIVDYVIPDSFADRQAASLQEKAEALTEQIEAIPEIPDALKEKFEADLALADAMQEAYVAGRADLSVLEESARLRAETVTEMGILAAEAGSLVLGGAGLAVKAARGMGRLDLGDIPGGAIGALSRAADVSRSLAADLRSFALDETGSIDLPGGTLNRADLEAVEVARAADLHRAARWDEYQARGGEWDYDRWSTTYEQNQTRALEANARVAEYQDQIGWGQVEQTVIVEIDGVDHARRLDIADVGLSRGIEHKSGYQSLNESNRWELERDAELVDRDWEITWTFDTEPSAPLRQALKDAGIGVELRE